MNTFIHPTAQVSDKAILQPGCWIGPNVVVEEGAVIGHYSVIGGAPEHSKFYYDPMCERTKGVLVCKNARIFEFVTVQSGTERPTKIGIDSAVFQHSHVSHDCILEPNVTVCGRSSLAGFVVAMVGATVGAHSIVHQHCVLGAMSFLAMGTVLKAHVPTGEIWGGYPARQIGVNTVGLGRAGLNQEEAATLFKVSFTQLMEKSRL